MAGLTGNTKDTGNVNVRTDFIWGNLPPAPNDDRGGNTLDLTLGNHSLINVDWSAFPAATTGRGTKHRKVPSIADQATKAAVVAALKAVGFEEKDVTWVVDNTACATKNYGTFKSSTPAATTQTTNPGDGVTITMYGSTPVVLVKNNAPSVKVVSLEPDATTAAGNADGSIVSYDWEVIDANGTKTKYQKTAATAFNHTFATAGTQAVYLTITTASGYVLKSVVRNFTTT